MIDFRWPFSAIFAVGRALGIVLYLALGFPNALEAEGASVKFENELTNLIVEQCLRASLQGQEIDPAGLQELRGPDAEYWREDYDGPIYSIREDGVDHVVLTLPTAPTDPVCHLTHRGLDRAGFLKFIDSLFVSHPDLIAVDDMAMDEPTATVRGFGVEFGDDFRLAIAVNVSGLNSSSFTVHTPESLEAES